MNRPNVLRRVGLRRAVNLVLRAEVERSGAENASTRIHVGVADRSAQALCWERSKSRGLIKARDEVTSNADALVDPANGHRAVTPDSTSRTRRDHVSNHFPTADSQAVPADPHSSIGCATVEMALLI